MNAEQYADRRAQIAELTRQGFRPNDIAAQLGVHLNTVYNFRLSLGLVRQQFGGAEADEALRLLQAGWSYRAVGDKLRRSPKTIAGKFPGYSHTASRPSPTRHALAERRERVAAMTRQGRKVAEVAGTLGVSTAAVIRDRRALGITRTIARMTEIEKRAARALLDDGASYHETALTLGRTVQTVERHAPGYPKRTPAEMARNAALGRAMARLERTPNLIAPQRKGKAA